MSSLFSSVVVLLMIFVVSPYFKLLPLSLLSCLLISYSLVYLTSWSYIQKIRKTSTQDFVSTFMHLYQNFKQTKLDFCNNNLRKNIIDFIFLDSLVGHTFTCFPLWNDLRFLRRCVSFDCNVCVSNEQHKLQNAWKFEKHWTLRG